MSKLPDFVGKYPLPPSEKKPVVITKARAKQYIYPDKAEGSDFNWAFASTDKTFVGIYQLSPGARFFPADVHAGDEVYYILNGTLTVVNPETGEVHEVHENEGYFIPEGGWHQAFNFTQGKVRILILIAPKIWPPEGLPEKGYPGKARFFEFGSNR